MPRPRLEERLCSLEGVPGTGRARRTLGKVAGSSLPRLQEHRRGRYNELEKGQERAANQVLYRSGPEATYGLLGKDLDMFSEAGFDMEKIHLKVRCLPLFLHSEKNPANLA